MPSIAKFFAAACRRFRFPLRRETAGPRSLHHVALSNISEEARTRYAPGGYHPVRVGDVFNDGKYRVLRKLGYGLYSTVWLAHDVRSKKNVALKILTADTYDGKNDSFELDILRRIREKGAAQPGSEHVLGLLDEFRHAGPNGQHVCLVFKAMGPDTSTLRDLFPRRRLPVPMAKKLARDLVTALAFLHDACGVIHTDIKPRNILVETAELNDMFAQAPPEVFHPEDPPLPPPDDYYMPSEPVVSGHEDLATADASFRLADFGTSSWKTKHLTEWIQPDMLRAPEVILGAGWDQKADIWNAGLLIWELATGQLCFDGQATATAPYSSAAHLAQMEAILGPLPESLVARSKRRDEFFNEKGQLSSGIAFPSFSLTGICQGSGAFDTQTDRDAFVAFVESMLALEPKQRPDARELLDAAWLKTAS